MSQRKQLTAESRQSAQIVAQATAQSEPCCRWSLPSGTPVLRRGLCALAQPVLTQVQYTPRFLFHDATVLLVAAGRLDLNDNLHPLAVDVVSDAPGSLLLVEPGTSVDLLKTPDEQEKRFRSIFLTLSTSLLEMFQRYGSAPPSESSSLAPYRLAPLDEDLESTLHRALEGVDAKRVSDERLQCRLMDFLFALAERGHAFKGSRQSRTAGRLRTLIGEAPDQNWTAQEAGRALAMSEATLRRRLAGEGVRFEELLIDTRMHHALMLLQTTSWTIPHIAQACGYQSRARFSDRFRTRFGYLPSAVR
ncbi:helix-turn-helix domain-containing protein [Alcaligenes phenolicus]|uniref:helix-turn-helix domain-containing protein n=1 Tax=Alcaligenes TaxID=507 RepID=UPI0021196661|nr:helix-turn-helix domain-containing protein [Alcaligenes phenolicus]